MNNTEIILQIVKKIEADIDIIKKQQSQTSEDMAIFHELHSKCPGVKALKMLDTKGMVILQTFVNNPILLIMIISLLFGTDIYEIIMSFIK